MKIRPVEAKLFHTDGRTDRLDEANNDFSKICKSVKKTNQITGKIKQNVPKVKDKTNSPIKLYYFEFGKLDV